MTASNGMSMFDYDARPVTPQVVLVGNRASSVGYTRDAARSRAVWDTGSFLLNGLVFILIGLHLLRIVPALATRTPSVLIPYGVLISVTARHRAFRLGIRGRTVFKSLARNSRMPWLNGNIPQSVP